MDTLFVQPGVYPPTSWLAGEEGAAVYERAVGAHGGVTWLTRASASAGAKASAKASGRTPINTLSSAP